ncbi:hypothetical protein [Paraburkholderia silvatlantica]|uniref:Uncharacterized protein n=1 Tax=Paraburkholderia silvatlantica TaxID=321895 RepID=A0ABR6FGC8_9BURK|nr:hypothetical protein [Paraburkholderia silvatlantica]MBB2926177.1 hypothetical protein [Paraburkholderia silvatlantica]PVY26731.1 hypothetical protein C7411_1225 [Paraburkholderia silvatlantica]PXW33018.1 hypothetical protein C7413_1215 [Paraburkholderia silvatlantica]TDQ80678.1 hypothetical protein C7412_1275 [Paraburkholderia silvatlantica]
MTPQRFHTLVAAYGADPQRWPQHEREDALEWARAHRAEASAALDEAMALDSWLSRDMVAPPSRTLFEQIVAGAPVTPVAAAKRRSFWWSGAAFAGVGLAGALAGALTISFVVLGGTTPAAPHETYLSTSFGGTSSDWSESNLNPGAAGSDE